MKNTGNPNSPQLEDAEAVCSLPCSSFQKTVDLQSSSPSSSAVFLKNNLDSPWGMLKKRHKDLLINQCCPKKKKMLVSKTVSLFQEKRKNLIVSKLFPRALEAPVTISTEKATVKAKTFWLFYNWHGTMVANRGLESLTFKGFLPFHSLLSWNIKLLPSDAKANQGTSRKNQIKVFWGLKKNDTQAFQLHFRVIISLVVTIPCTFFSLCSRHSCVKYKSILCLQYCPGEGHLVP